MPPLNPPPPRHVAREAWYGLFTQALDKVVPVAIILYLARTLAPEQFGREVLAAAGLIERFRFPS